MSLNVHRHERKKKALKKQRPIQNRTTSGEAEEGQIAVSSSDTTFWTTASVVYEQPWDLVVDADFVRRAASEVRRVEAEGKAAVGADGQGRRWIRVGRDGLHDRGGERAIGHVFAVAPQSAASAQGPAARAACRIAVVVPIHSIFDDTATHGRVISQITQLQRNRVPPGFHHASSHETILV